MSTEEPRRNDSLVTMPDGARLDVSAFIPEEGRPTGGWPAVVVVHGHGDNTGKAQTLGVARHMALRGYVGVTYSVRGQGASEGLSHTLSIQEVYDLQELLSWLTRSLPVDPERLAVVGRSQGGWHALMAAAHDLRVACAIAEVVPTDLAQMAMPNGAMSRWWYTATMRRKILTAGYPEVIRRWTVEDRWDLVEEWARVRSPLLLAHRITCPVMMVQGWWDEPIPVNHVMAMWERLQVPKKMVMTPGGHGHPESEEEMSLRLRTWDQWLDRWLKGQGPQDAPEREVFYLVSNTGEERHADSFPPAGTRRLRWFLHADGTLARRPPQGPAPPSSVRNRLTDPAYDLAAAINDDFTRTPQAVPQDALTFDSEPLQEPLEVAGIPRFLLHVASDSPWLQVGVRLLDVAPDGSVSPITRGHVARRGIEAGKLLHEAFDGVAMAYRIQAGHRLRLEVSNSGWPAVVPFYRNFLCRIFHEERLPSSFQLPVAPSTT